jgi:hypothetical protein
MFLTLFNNVRMASHSTLRRKNQKIEDSAEKIEERLSENYSRKPR